MREELQVWADSREDLGEGTAVLRGLAAWLASQPRSGGGSYYPIDEADGYDIPAPRDDSHGDGDGRITDHRFEFPGGTGFALIDGTAQGNGDGLGGGQGCLICDYPNEQISGDGFGDGDSHVCDGGVGPGFGNGPRTVLSQNDQLGRGNGDGGSVAFIGRRW